jgi:hypothetical protein
VHLARLGLKNFRSFEDEEILFSKDLTIFVGENNGGKSNAVDAIRLLTIPLSGRREIYCESTDIRHGSHSRSFEIEMVLEDLNPAQQGRLISAATDNKLTMAIFGLTYDESKKKPPYRPSLWASGQRSTPEPGCHQKIGHVYLPPLRDAKRALASATRHGSTLSCTIFWERKMRPRSRNGWGASQTIHSSRRSTRPSERACGNSPPGFVSRAPRWASLPKRR